jgi:TetR/AcrR family transcriptional regulator, transcriptional repressor for nem operon
MNVGLGSREKILFSARDLFYVVGYQTTSVDDILRVCGVAKSNFYYHFRTKDDLAVAVLELHIAEFEAGALRALADASADPGERFQRFCDAIVRTQAELHKMGGCPFGNFAAALSIRDGDEKADRFRRVLRGVFGRVTSSLAACLGEGAQSGVFRDDVPADHLALTVLAAVEGLLLMTKTERSEAPLLHGLPVLQRLLRLR